MHWPSFAYGVVAVYVVSFAALALHVFVVWCSHYLLERRIREQEERVRREMDRADRSMANYARLLDDMARDPIEGDWRVTGVIGWGPDGVEHHLKTHSPIAPLEAFHPADQKILREVMK